MEQASSLGIKARHLSQFLKWCETLSSLDTLLIAEIYSVLGFYLFSSQMYNKTMNPKSVFNATVCLLGVLILLIHVVNIVLKKGKRKDEKALFAFFVFTMVHFATYFTFVLIKENYVSKPLIITFYTIFYIMNNVELLLFYFYFSNYAVIPTKTKRVADIINIVLFSLFVISDIINIFTHMYFSAEGGIYQREKFMIISQGYQFLMLGIIFILVIINKSLNVREKIAFSMYCVLPLVSIILQNRFAGFAIAYATLLMAIEILFLFLNVEKNIKIREEEKQLKDAEVKIMVSQIQPHFVYNTLSSISTLIDIDPEKAQKALDEFTDYLRMNFSTLTATKQVSFEDELKHIKTYVDLEKMRFNDRLNVIYDIKATNFTVPPLSIQPLVENAIKHGILKKIEGGTVILKTYEDEKAFIVEVIDDGIGFDMKTLDPKDNKHIGLSNVKHRVTTMANGDIYFESEPNKGTKVVVKFYK